MTIPMKLFDFFFMNLPGKSLWNLDAHADSGTRSPPPPTSLPPGSWRKEEDSPQDSRPFTELTPPGGDRTIKSNEDNCDTSILQDPRADINRGILLGDSFGGFFWGFLTD